MQFEPNQTIANKYVLEKKLGEGGIAVVYKMRHLDLDTPFAIKILKVSTPSLKQRLELEAKVQAQLRHPNIVGVTDVIREEQYLGLVMEFVEGVGMDEFLLERTLTMNQAEKIFLDILDGLEEAHDSSIIHRDLKPGNVMIKEKRGRFQVKICDFGLAKALNDEGASNTVTGTAMGTPAYMAPEQIRNAKNVDERADIFSMGVILYEMLSGKKPFNGASHMDIMTAVVSRDPTPIDQLMPNLPRRYVNAVNGALNKNRQERISNCAEFRAILLGEKGDEKGGALTGTQDTTDSIIMDGLDLMSGEYSVSNLEERIAERELLEDDDLQQIRKKPKGQEVSLYDISGIQELKREEFVPSFKPKQDLEAEAETQMEAPQPEQPAEAPKPEAKDQQKIQSATGGQSFEQALAEQPTLIEPPQPPVKKKNNGQVIFLIASVIIAVGALGFAFMSKQTKESEPEAKEIAEQKEEVKLKTEEIDEPEVAIEDKELPEEPPKEGVEDPPEEKQVEKKEAAEKKEPKKKKDPPLMTPALKKMDGESAKAVVSQFDSKTRGSSKVQECFANEQRASGSAPTRVPLIVTLASTGKVTSAKISEGEYAGSSFEGCLQTKLKALNYQGFDAGFKPLKFKYTLKR